MTITLEYGIHGGHKYVTCSGHSLTSEFDYAIGLLSPNHPVPSLMKERLCLFCGSDNGMCRRYPQRCLDDLLVVVRP